ncbi:MAG: hypothetical protein UH850_12690 [Paludibacteraceae bacterium]|nr:hypothetical protein [Paludibacteraceae bacterium]
MKTIKVTTRLSAEERETLLNYDNVDKVWTMDSTIPKHFNRALRQKWTPITQYVYEDGTVCGMVLTAPDRAITIRSTEKKQMSEKQMGNLPNNEDEDDEE